MIPSNFVILQPNMHHSNYFKYLILKICTKLANLLHCPQLPIRSTFHSPGSSHQHDLLTACTLTNQELLRRHWPTRRFYAVTDQPGVSTQSLTNQELLRSHWHSCALPDCWPIRRHYEYIPTLNSFTQNMKICSTIVSLENDSTINSCSSGI